VAAVAAPPHRGGPDPATPGRWPPWPGRKAAAAQIRPPPRLIDAMADDEVGRAAEEEERGKGKRAAWRKRQGACRGRRGSAGRTSEEEERGGRAHGVERERGENERLRDSGSGRARGR